MYYIIVISRTRRTLILHGYKAHYYSKRYLTFNLEFSVDRYMKMIWNKFLVSSLFLLSSLIGLLLWYNIHVKYNSRIRNKIMMKLLLINLFTVPFLLLVNGRPLNLNIWKPVLNGNFKVFCVDKLYYTIFIQTCCYFHLSYKNTVDLKKAKH